MHDDRPSAARNHAAWIAPLVGFVGLVSYFTVFVRFPSLRDGAWLNLAIVAVGLVLGTIALRRGFAPPSSVGRRVLAAVGFSGALLCAALLSAYVFVISSLVPEPTSVSLGLGQMPDLTLDAHDGRRFAFNAGGGRNTLLVFYRGHW